MSEDSQRRTRRGFTLVDLVVVTAFCGLLIAIMLPPGQQVRKQAQGMVCMSNLHQQYQAASEYAGDNDGFYPRGIQGLNVIGGEYNTYAAALLPYLGWDGEGRLWSSPQNDPQWNITLKQLNKTLLGFDVFHCPGFPASFYDDPNDQRYFYASAVDEELYGPGGENPLHYVVSAFDMPYPQQLIDSDGSPCWDPNGDVEGHAPNPGYPQAYVGASRLVDFPENCPPDTKVYATEVDKSAPWVKRLASGGAVISVRYHAASVASQLGFSSHGRIGEDRRHSRGLNCLFFDGHVQTIATDELDPGCETPLDYRLRYFSIPWDGWDGWDDP